MLTFVTTSGWPYTWSSTTRLNSMPNWFTFTLLGVRMVSLRLAPVRALSLCCVRTFTWAKAGSTSSNTVMTAIKRGRGAERSENREFILVESPQKYVVLVVVAQCGCVIKVMPGYAMLP